MGHLATALGVAPAPRRRWSRRWLNPIGALRTARRRASHRRRRKLAGAVLRRHRLIELFLVKIPAAGRRVRRSRTAGTRRSERLIDRIDQMLGRPAVDPHGDPIRTPEGMLPRRQQANLLTAPVHTRLVVERVLAQDAEFLRCVEEQQLMPGSNIVIDSRDPAADAVRVLTSSNQVIAVGTRAASNILVSTGVIAG